MFYYFIFESRSLGNLASLFPRVVVTKSGYCLKYIELSVLNSVYVFVYNIITYNIYTNNISVVLPQWFKLSIYTKIQ